jgi:hypothetical protein
VVGQTDPGQPAGLNINVGNGGPWEPAPGGRNRNRMMLTRANIA